MTVPLDVDESVDHAAWEARRQSLAEPASAVLRFASWYEPVLDRWKSLAADLGVWNAGDEWVSRRDESCRKRDDALAHLTDCSRVNVHLLVEDGPDTAKLVARYCRRAPVPLPEPRYTDDQRLTFEELVAGEPCRGCGRGFRGGPEWKPVRERTPEEQAAHDVEEAAFLRLHPACGAMRWTISGGGVNHCSVCCPPPPFGPEQTKHLARLLIDIAESTAAREADLERRWREATRSLE